MTWWARLVQVYRDNLKNEVEWVLNAATIAVGAGAVELGDGKVKHPGVFIDVLRDRKFFFEVDFSSVDKVNKV